jgi:hypothetical protein
MSHGIPRGSPISFGDLDGCRHTAVVEIDGKQGCVDCDGLWLKFDKLELQAIAIAVKCSVFRCGGDCPTCRRMMAILARIDTAIAEIAG